MKIANTNVAMQSEHRAATRRVETETFRAWRGERPNFESRPSTRTQLAQLGQLAQRAPLVHVSDAARARFAAEPSFPSITDGLRRGPSSFQQAAPSNSEVAAIESASDEVDNDPFLAMVRQMVEFLTGEEVRVFDWQDFSASLSHAEARTSSTSERLQGIRSEGADRREDYGVEYDYHSVTEEFEETTFSASGTIRTADGQEISFNIDLEMTRYHREETHVSLRSGNAVRKDPLVVNFGGSAAQLAQHAGQRFSFDLDGDGTAEMLPLFTSGSGYLAFDLNGDGKIDSGKELFGPQSGNGFLELALLDADGNGWVDDGDEAFDKLSVWTPDAAGEGTLSSLVDLGIGALGLKHMASPFALRGEDYSDLGMVKSSGVYLTEDGKAGSLQEIDITV
jgi:hypothetical protein